MLSGLGGASAVRNAARAVSYALIRFRRSEATEAGFFPAVISQVGKNLITESTRAVNWRATIRMESA